MKHAERAALEALLAAACDRDGRSHEVAVLIAALERLAQVEEEGDES